MHILDLNQFGKAVKCSDQKKSLSKWKKLDKLICQKVKLGIIYDKISDIPF